MGQASSSSSSSSHAGSAPVPEHSVLDVELEIVAAKDIAAGDYFGMKAALKGHVASSDAYALIEVAGQKVAWTRPIFDTLEPVWNEKFFFRNVRPDTLCKLYLLDKDFDGDDALGQTQFTAANTDGAETTFELPITRKEKAAGSIVVKVKSHATKVHGDGKLQQVGPVHYSGHLSVTTGVLTHSMTDDDKLQASAYHVQLHNIQQLLPNDHEWNKNYPTIQKIFSPDHPESPVLRKAIATEHAVIYKHGSTTEYGQLKEPADFFSLLHGGKRLDKPVLFTYAITSTGWYFSETGASFFKDMLSKHMLHSGAAFSVKYAGEFRIEKGHFGKYKLVIDNNSGTYAPPKEDLPKLKEIFEYNFPGISVEALDRDDEELQKGRQEILDAWA
ncbi:putative C2 domain-containing protein [Phytophthora cinnamomi]|uniref:putative C2 domain-containing protein n=1 Tax=Phytophthora cinnamomi TaxID=4785 RepID=UPI00355AA938|nr:putative C2 domain-containing protein [Phytophthora cinnamomi]